ncbi:MAG: ABC transporter substrate-binding protein [Clostridiales bacterium]|nr:ABC transporter substrate-binding protein [Clostridiales bacterium]
MSKHIFALILLFFVILGLVACNNFGSNDVIKIGISQLAEHAALDSAREGFIEALEEAGYKDGENIKLDFQNAQGDINNAQTIARKFADENMDMILAIATPAAEAAANVTSDIPILITAVTDPIEAGLTENLESPTANVTGTTDMNPVKEQIELLAELIPTAKNIGILYNAGEINSQVQVDIAKDIVSDMGLNLIEATVSNTSEVSQATQSLMGRVDAIYVPTDNTIVSSIGAVIKVSNDHNIPVIGSERGQVDAGAVAVKGIDYKLLGKQTGEIAVKILKDGKTPKDLPIEDTKDIIFIINKKAAKDLGVEISAELEAAADEVIE